MRNKPEHDPDYAEYLDDVYDRAINAIVNEHFDDDRLRAIYDLVKHVDDDPAWDDNHISPRDYVNRYPV